MKDLGEQISQKCAALQLLRDECDDGDQVDRCQFACNRDKTIQACVELARQVNESWQDPQRVWRPWCCFTVADKTEEEEEEESLDPS